MSVIFSIRRRFFLTLLAVATLLIFPGCSKKAESSFVPKANFDSAPPELKEKWKGALDSAGKNEFLSEFDQLTFLLEKSAQLSADQKNAVDQAWLELGNKSFTAANQGDANATKVVLQMRDSKFGAKKR